ncbi:conserved hypothetical protein [Enterobacterales bacterium 8AC]|nr:conserved hypothetical protein [Enterobacterales bacterium 8AC]
MKINGYIMHEIELELKNIIRKLLIKHNHSRKWLANATGIDYERVKRLLNDRSNQRLSIVDAELMLNALGTDLRRVLISPLLKKLRDQIDEYE